MEKFYHNERLKIARTAGDDAFFKAISAYDDARVDGLCHEGAWEIALQALQSQKSDNFPDL